MTNYTHEELRRGKRLCRDLMPRLKAQARKDLRNPDRHYMKPETGVGQDMLQQIRFKNIEALVIYCRNGNEWHADVVLKNMGLGRPHVIGTRSSCPLPTEQEAKHAGIMLLKSVVSTCVENDMASSTDKKTEEVRHFILFNIELSIDYELLSKLHQDLQHVREMLPEMVPDLHDVVDQFEIRLKEYFGETGFSRAHWEALCEDSKMKLLANIVQLVLHGVPRYPMAGRAAVCEMVED